VFCTLNIIYTNIHVVRHEDKKIEDIDMWIRNMSMKGVVNKRYIILVTDHVNECFVGPKIKKKKFA